MHDQSSDVRKDVGIDYFDRGHILTRLQEQASLRVRRRMLDTWLNYCAAVGCSNRKILDIGGTPDTERSDSNCMIKWLLELNKEIVLTSPENISHLQLVFPGVRIARFSKDAIVDSAEHFDFSLASAVIEHVGIKQNQIEFIRKASEKSNGLFLTTPNRWHWLEFHTKFPLIHWLPKPLHRLILRAIGKHFWSKEDNLNLISKREFLEIAQIALGNKYSFEVKQVWFMGMPSNLILLAHRNSKD